MIQEGTLIRTRDKAGTTSFYTVKELIEVTDNHIKFIDKFDKVVWINLCEVMKIVSVGREK